MLFEDPSGRELSQFMSHHILSYEYRIEHLAVVNQKCMPDEIRGDRRAARPCFDRFLGPRIVQAINLLKKMQIYKRSFFERSSHR